MRAFAAPKLGHASDSHHSRALAYRRVDRLFNLLSTRKGSAEPATTSISLHFAADTASRSTRRRSGSFFAPRPPTRPTASRWSKATPIRRAAVAGPTTSSSPKAKPRRARCSCVSLRAITSRCGRPTDRSGSSSSSARHSPGSCWSRSTRHTAPRSSPTCWVSRAPRDSSSRASIAASTCAAVLDEVRGALPELRHVVFFDDWAAFAASGREPAARRWSCRTSRLERRCRSSTRLAPPAGRRGAASSPRHGRTTRSSPPCAVAWASAGSTQCRSSTRAAVGSPCSARCGNARR